MDPGSDSPAAAASPGWVRWFPASAALLFLGLLLPGLGEGTLFHNDELLTAERAREMLVLNDFSAVSFNFQTTFKKPPLQYWATALCLRAFPHQREFAARLPTLVLGALCLWALGWAARRTAPPSRSATAPVAAVVAALALYGPFIHHSRHALLDSGAALLLLVLLVACHLARTDPRWWAGAAVAAVLGAGQKAPFGLAAWGLILLLRWRRGELPPPGPRGRVDRGWLVGSLVAALFLILAWPAWQTARFGLGNVLVVGEKQARDLMIPSRSSGFQPWLYW